MNYKNHTIREVKEFSEQFPDYSMGELLYSGLRFLKIKKVSDLLHLSDEDVYTAFSKAIEEEKEE